MPTRKQVQTVALKTAVVVGGDKFIYGKGLSMKPALLDSANLAVTEYITRDKVMQLTDNMFQGMDSEQKKLVVDIVLDVLQDRAVQMWAGGRSRSWMESFVTFGLAEFVGSQVASRFPENFA